MTNDTIMDRFRNISENINVSKLNVSAPSDVGNEMTSFLRNSSIGNLYGLVVGIVVWLAIFEELTRTENNYNTNTIRALGSTNIITCTIIIYMVYAEIFLSSQYLLWFLILTFLGSVGVVLYKRAVAI